MPHSAFPLCPPLSLFTLEFHCDFPKSACYTVPFLTHHFPMASSLGFFNFPFFMLVFPQVHIPFPPSFSWLSPGQQRSWMITSSIGLFPHCIRFPASHWDSDSPQTSSSVKYLCLPVTKTPQVHCHIHAFIIG